MPNVLKVFLLVCFLFFFQEMAFALDVEKEYRSSFEQGGKLVLRRLRPTAVFQWAKLLKGKEDGIENGGSYKGRVEIKWTGAITQRLHTMVVDIWLTAEGNDMFMTKYSLQQDDGSIPIVVPKEREMREKVGSASGGDF